MQNCGRCIENDCFKHKNLVGCRGASLPWPPPGALPLAPRWGLRRQTPIIGSRSRARHGCVFDPHFSLPSTAPDRRPSEQLAILFNHDGHVGFDRLGTTETIGGLDCLCRNLYVSATEISWSTVSNAADRSKRTSACNKISTASCTYRQTFF